MTRDDTVAMAREAGATPYTNRHYPDLPYHTFNPEQLERFAALVAAAERNKLAEWMMAKGYATGHGDTIEDLLDELEWQVRERQRQRLHDKFMEIHKSQQHSNNYWHFAAKKILEES